MLKPVQDMVAAHGVREMVQKRLSFERPFTTPVSPSEQQISDGFTALQPRTGDEGGERKAGGRGGTVRSHAVEFGIYPVGQIPVWDLPCRLNIFCCPFPPQIVLPQKITLHVLRTTPFHFGDP